MKSKTGKHVLFTWASSSHWLIVLFFIKHQLCVKLPTVSLNYHGCPWTHSIPGKANKALQPRAGSFFLTQPACGFLSAPVPPRNSLSGFFFAFYTSQDAQPYFYTQDTDYTRIASGKYFIISLVHPGTVLL